MRSVGCDVSLGKCAAATTIARGAYRSAIIVGEANSLVAQVHDRMPVMLVPEDYARRLDPSTSSEEARGMLKPYDAELMQSYEVNRAVSSVKNDTEQCIEPLSD
jgi:putative SOS response-associated peptidase YedK